MYIPATVYEKAPIAINERWVVGGGMKKKWVVELIELLEMDLTGQKVGGVHAIL